MAIFNTIDHFIVYAFLLLTLLIGLWVGRKIKDFQEYALANKIYGTGLLTITLLASYIGGWHLFGFPGDIFADGIIHLLITVGGGVVVCLLFIAWFIAPQMIHFQDHLTMGDLMYTFYGSHGRLITGLIGFVYNLTAVSIQLLFLKPVCELLAIREDWGLSLGALVLVIYASSGGIKSVTITDVVQFAIILVVVPLLANLITYQAGGIKTILSSLPAEKLQINFAQDKANAYGAGYYSFPILLVWFLFPGFPLSFPFIQRTLIASSKRQLSHIYYISIAFLIMFFLLLALIGFATLALYPHLDSKTMVPYLINQLPQGLKGLTIIGALAIIMSSADSFLHAAGISLTHDVVQPFCAKRGIVIHKLQVVKQTTFFTGCISILVALVAKDPFKVAIYGMDLAALLFTIPLIAGIMGLRTDIKAFASSLVATLAVFILAHGWLDKELALPVCIFTNLLSFLGVHVWQNKGFAVVKRASSMESTWVWRVTWKGFIKRLARAKGLLHYSEGKLAKYGASPSLFALFMSLNYMVPFFMHTYTASATYKQVLVIRSIGAILCVGLILKPYWPVWLRRYFAIYYHFSLLYCLPFLTTFLFLIERGNVEWIINVAFSIMLLIVLADWVSFIVLAAAGVGIGLLFYTQVVGKINFTLDFTTAYLLVYTLIFATLITLLFARRKQKAFQPRLFWIGGKLDVLLISHQNKAAEVLAEFINHHIEQYTHKYTKAKYLLMPENLSPQQQAKSTLEIFHELMPIALAIAQQGNSILKEVTAELKYMFMLDHLAPLSIKACLEEILEDYFFSKTPIPSAWTYPKILRP